jgi:hypothetical protein
MSFNLLLGSVSMVLLSRATIGYCDTLTNRGPALEKTATVKLPESIPYEVNVNLPQHYVHKRMGGIDSFRGCFSKENGISIDYDIGEMAKDFVQNRLDQNDSLWFKRQAIGKKVVEVLLTKDSFVCIRIPGLTANFKAKVKNPGDLAEALLIVASLREPVLLYGKKANSSGAPK